MKKTDYYIVYIGLLIAGLGLLYFGEEMYSGMFLGVFFTGIKEILNIKEEALESTLTQQEKKEALEVFDNM